MKQVLRIFVVALVSAAVTSAALANETVNGSKSKILELRSGDQIPINFAVEGAFVETVAGEQVIVRAKRNLWLKLSEDSVEMSLDGQNFKPISKLTSGSLSVGIDDQTREPNIGLKLEEQ